MTLQDQADHEPRKPRRRKAAPTAIAPADSFTPLQQTVGRLAREQRQRQFCIGMQGRLNRSMESYIARQLGYDNELDGTVRKRLFTRAAKMRESAEKYFEAGRKGKKPRLPTFDDPKEAQVFRHAFNLLEQTWLGRLGFDTLRDKTERDMVALAKTLPGAGIVEEIRGFGYKGLAIIVAECHGEFLNGFDDYPSVAKVYKRMGVALVGEERQRKKSDPDEAEEHKYSPRRRAELFGAIGDPLFRTQSAGDGPYRQLYDRRRAHTAVTHPDWTLGHSHNDARRYMEKKLLHALWRAWRKATGQPVHTGNGRRRAATEAMPTKAGTRVPPAAPRRKAKRRAA